MSWNPTTCVRAVAMVACAAAIGACGSSGQSRGAGPAGGPLLAYARCIRAHGVPDFPDPRATGGLVIPSSIDPQSPAFQAAEQACAKLSQPAGSQAGSYESAKLRLLALATCMRAHGVSSFHDPTSSPPPPSGGNAIGGDGWWLSLGTPQEQRSPAYRKAAGACGTVAP